jgi:predicted esterase
MVRAPWRKRSRHDVGRHAIAPLVALVLLSLSIGLASRPARAGEVTMLPSAEGNLGAWLALGPLYADAKTPGAHTLDATLLDEDESSLAGQLGRSLAVPTGDAGTRAGLSASWRIVSSGSGLIDVAAELSPKKPETYAYLYGTLHLAQALRGLLLVGASDGVRVWIDQKKVWSNEATRIEHDDEDIIRVDLAAGDHPILIKLHHREGYWAVRARIVDMSFAPPRGASLRLPGTTEADARALGPKMADVDVEHGLSATGFQPSVSVAFPGGMPRGTDRSVRVSSTARTAGKATALFSVDAGQIPLGASGPTRFKVRLPPISQRELRELESEGDLAIEVQVAGRSFENEVPFRSYLFRAVAAADRGLELIDAGDGFLGDAAVARATLEHLRERFVRYLDAGSDIDREALAKDAQEIVDVETDLRARRDPLRSHAKLRRFAYRSPLDGELSPFGVYVPESYVRATNGGKRYPLVVALHGLNGKPLSMLAWFFGRDDESHDSEWEDRHLPDVDAVEGFVVAPNAYGNAMYREAGEVDVMSVLDWATQFFPIDKDRITITGVSMGGTGTASIAFHYPDSFAAAEPLCGYHSYFVRKDFLRPGLKFWEKALAEQRSNSLWAENGLYLPLYVWHGKRDWPEKNSGVLIERYEALGYAIQHEHPDVGHDVWKRAYDGAAGFQWLAQKTRPEHKPRIVFKTDSPRYHDDAWVHLDEISTDLEFATIEAQVVEPTLIDVATRRVESLSLDRDPALVTVSEPTRVRLDGTTLVFAPGEPIRAYRDENRWKPGKREASGTLKRAGLSGPVRDVFHEPLLFVYGTQDPAQTRANRDTARAWGRVRWGVDTRYPIIADTELTDALAEAHSLVLVGNATSNRIVRALEPKLPFRVTSRGVSANVNGQRKRTWFGSDLGVAFVYPNPEHPARYVLVLEGTNALGTFRSMALPDLLPDFAVYDERVAPARGQLSLGDAALLGAGLFRRDWSFRPADLGR